MCPDVQVPSSTPLLATAYTAPSGAAPSSQNYSDGITTTLRAKLNRNALGQDLTGRYGGGGYAIAYGLTLSAPSSGLNLNVAAGHAMIDGTVELSAQTVAVPSSYNRAFVWLTQAGALTVTSSKASPGGNCCYLGNCTVGGGNIVGVDFSGVCYLRGGQIWRETADEGEPGDTPSASVAFWALTQGGLWLWDGTEYRQISEQTTEIDARVSVLETQREDADRRFRQLLGHLYTISADFVPPILAEEAVMGLSELSIEGRPSWA